MMVVILPRPTRDLLIPSNFRIRHSSHPVEPVRCSEADLMNLNESVAWHPYSRAFGPDVLAAIVHCTIIEEISIEWVGERRVFIAMSQFGGSRCDSYRGRIRIIS